MWWIGLVGCSWMSTEVVPAPPREASDWVAPLAPRSSISVPVTLALEGLRAQVEAKVPEVVMEAKDEPLDPGVVGDVKVIRDGAPRVDVSADALRVVVPLSLEVKPRPAFAKGAKASVGVVRARLEAVVEVAPQWDAQWDLTPRVRVSHRWIDPPRLQVGPLKIDLTRKTDVKLAERFEVVQQDLARDLSRDLNPRAKVEEAWRVLHEPRRLSESPAAWLVLGPEGLTASPLRVSPAGIEVEVGLTGQMSVVTGAPPAASPPGPLPDRASPTGPAGVAIAGRLTVGWPELTQALQQNLNQLPAGVAPGGGPPKPLQLQRVAQIYPSGEQLALGLDVSANLGSWQEEARVWVLARPSLVGDALHLDQLELFLEGVPAPLGESGAWTVEIANTLLGTPMVVPLREPLQEMREELNTRLSEPPPPGGPPVRLEGEVERIALRALTLTQEGLVVDTLLEGRLAVTVLR